ncbi:hypothetical protein D3C87_1782650 [compost metagenome]
MREHDVEANGGRAHIGRAAIARLHDARTAPGGHDEFLEIERGRGLRGQLGELAGLVIIA